MTEQATTKPKPPPLKDWREQVENEMKRGGHEKEDVLKIIWLAQDLLSEMGPGQRWVSEQSTYLNSIASEYMRIYITRFGAELPPRPQKETRPEILLYTPGSRKQAVRDVALAITKPGNDVSDEAVLEELKRRGMNIDAANPTATISTILNGFKSQFEKVKGKRGVFRRRE